MFKCFRSAIYSNFRNVKNNNNKIERIERNSDCKIAIVVIGSSDSELITHNYIH